MIRDGTTFRHVFPAPSCTHRGAAQVSYRGLPSLRSSELVFGAVVGGDADHFLELAFALDGAAPLLRLFVLGALVARAGEAARRHDVGARVLPDADLALATRRVARAALAFLTLVLALAVVAALVVEADHAAGAARRLVVLQVAAVTPIDRGIAVRLSAGARAAIVLRAGAHAVAALVAGRANDAVAAAAQAPAVAQLLALAAGHVDLAAAGAAAFLRAARGRAIAAVSGIALDVRAGVAARARALGAQRDALAARANGRFVAARAIAAPAMLGIAAE